MPRDKIRLIALVALLCIIFADVIYSAINGYSHLLSARVVILAILVLFVAVGDSIRSVSFGLFRGLTIEGKIAETQKDLAYLDSLTNQGGTQELNELLEGATKLSHGVWSQLLLYRLALRALLRRLCLKNNIGIRDAESITNMLGSLRKNNIIDQKLSDALNHIRDVTYVVEWGVGRRPSNEEIKNVLLNASSLLRDLGTKIGG